tara:strand:+ start:2870 stop:3025 length:156 start_codon:yes stop_codon:yes gene_type:complete
MGYLPKEDIKHIEKNIRNLIDNDFLRNPFCKESKLIKITGIKQILNNRGPI